MISWEEIAARLGIRGRASYNSVAIIQAENEAVADWLRANGYDLADERKVSLIRQHYNTRPWLWLTPFVNYATLNFGKFYPN